jgi:hypothetical protein
MASDRIGDGLGGFVVEGTTALTILHYLLSLYVSGRRNLLWNKGEAAISAQAEKIALGS